MATRTKKMLMMVAAVAAMLAPSARGGQPSDDGLYYCELNESDGTATIINYYTEETVKDAPSYPFVGNYVTPTTLTFGGKSYRVTEIDMSFVALGNCTSVTFSDGLKKIRIEYVDCPIYDFDLHRYTDYFSLSNVKLPDGLMELSLGLPYELSVLPTDTFFTIKNGLRIVDGYVIGFSDAYKENMPESMDLDLRGMDIRGIANGAFDGYHEGSSRIKSVTLPASVTSICPGAFSGCTNLKSVKFEGDAPAVADGYVLFPSGTKIYVKPGTKGWGDVPGTWGGATIAYEPKDVNVTFQFNYSGGGSGKTETIKSDEPVLPYAPEVPTRKGFEFVGWFTAPTGGEQINASTTTQADAAYYAHWEPTTITVTLDPNFPGGLHFSRETYTLDKGDSLHDKIGKFWDTDIPAYTTQTHDFLGFFTAPDGGSLVTRDVVPTSDVTYYGHWAIKQYSVYFDPNGGTGGGWVTFNHGDRLVGPNTPVREGYEFWGWSLSTSGLSAIPQTVTADATYYAAWKRPSTPTTGVTDPYAAPKAVTLQGVAYDGGEVVGVVELKLGKVNKKGTSKVSGSFTGLDGKKITLKAATVEGIDGTSPASVSMDVKNVGTMTVTIGGDKFAGSLGDWHVQSGAVGGNWTKGTATVVVDAGDVSMFAGTVLSDLLPNNEQATASGGKWSFAKAAGVKWAKPKKGAEPPEIYDDESGKGLVIDTSAGKTNLSGLKLTYTPKKGTFKGSFKVYVLEGSGKATKLKKYTVNVTGLVVDGVGYGVATCKKPALRWSVSVR